MDESVSLKRCPCPEHEGPNPLPVTGFGKHRRTRDGVQSWCKTCKGRLNARWKQDNAEKVRETDRQYHEDNRDERNEQNRQRRQATRDAVLDHYGRVCACCGSAEDLQIDHVNGGGAAHRVELFGREAVSTEIYLWLIDNGFPDGFQTLCRPCNSSKKDGRACRIDHAAA